MPITLMTIGLSAGILGAIILAISMSSLVTVLNMVIGAQEIFFRSFNDPRGVVAMVGLDQQFERAKKKSLRFTIVGVLLLVLSFALQLISVIKSTS